MIWEDLIIMILRINMERLKSYGVFYWGSNQNSEEKNSGIILNDKDIIHFKRTMINSRYFQKYRVFDRKDMGCYSDRESWSIFIPEFLLDLPDNNPGIVIISNKMEGLEMLTKMIMIPFYKEKVREKYG